MEHLAQPTKALTRRERKAAETRERIFRAAIELFAERGPGSVTVEQITERADVGKGTFFNYFSSKEAVLNYFSADQVRRVHQALSTGAPGGTCAERVLYILCVLAEHPSLTRDLCRGLFIAALSQARLTETEGPSVWHLAEIIEGIIREGQESGEFSKDHRAREASMFILGQFYLAEMSWCTGFTDETLPDVVGRYGAIALDAFRSGR